MGMSSSQARLLTLTGRLHSIEYRAQKIEAEKLRLANDSDQVYENYLEKMQQTKYVANIMNEDGAMTYVNLTANAIYEYGTLQNQYSLIAKESGKTLIPSGLSNNYKNTDSLGAFLEAYGLTTAVEQTIIQTTPNQDYQDQVADYERKYAAWQQRCATIDQENADNLARYNAELAAYYQGQTDYESEMRNYETQYAQWVIAHEEWEEKNPELVKMDQIQEWWVHEDYSMADEFNAAATSGGSGTTDCYTNATSGSSGTSCYRHILAHIIEYDGTTSSNTFTTTLGQSTTLSGGGYCDNNSVTLSDGTVKNSNEIFAEVSDQLDMGIQPNTEGETCDVTESSTDYEKLVSKWNVDGTVKTMKQWAIDLNYVAFTASTNEPIDGFDDNFFSTLTEFQKKLEGSLVKFDEEVFNQKKTLWENNEPVEPVMPTFNGTMPTYTKIPYDPEPQKNITAPETNTTVQTVNHTTFRNKKLAEWYINLWYKMEGLNEVPNIVETVIHDDNTNSDIVLYSCSNINKSNTTYSTNADWNVEENENYMVIPDNMLNDPKWIKNAVAEGYVLIQEFNREENRFNDTSVSVTTRIQEIQDEVGLRKAETEYESDMRKINDKDRYYDTQLAQIEREHEATKTEIEQLKSVSKENVDRTFKLFT